MNQQTKKIIDLLKIFEVIKTNKLMIFCSSLAFMLIAVVYCIFATPIFTAKVLINPPRLSEAGSGVYGAIGSLSAAIGGGSLLLQKSDSDIAMVMMSTNVVRDMVVKQFNLNKYFRTKNIEATRSALGGRIKFASDIKSGFLEISVNDKNPKLAADIANYYVVALGRAINHIAWQKTNDKAQFFADQITQTKKDLDEIELSLKKFMQKNGILAGQQTQVIAGISTQLQTQLVSAQAQLQTMSSYASENNPDYKLLKSQIDSLKSRLNQLNNQNTDDKIIIPAGLAPELAQEYVTLIREMRLREQIYSVVVRQYEATKLDALSEVKPLAIQVIDPAVVPLYKSAPKRLLIILASFILGILLSSFYVLVKNRKLIFLEK